MVFNFFPKKLPRDKKTVSYTHLTQNGNLSGSLDAMGMRTEFQNGRIHANQCEFEGIVKTPFGSFPYSVTGNDRGSQIILEVKTEKGNFKIVGDKK